MATYIHDPAHNGLAAFRQNSYNLLEWATSISASKKYELKGVILLPILSPSVAEAYVFELDWWPCLQSA